MKPCLHIDVLVTRSVISIKFLSIDDDIKGTKPYVSHVERSKGSGGGEFSFILYTIEKF